MNDISTLKARLADLAEQHKAEMELKIQKLAALARMFDAEQTLREMEAGHE